MKEGGQVTDWLSPERSLVPTRGGDLCVARWGDEGPAVLALHGITASHMTWPWVARELSSAVRFIAPDLRGRGESRALPPPYGMKAHADDCIAVLDHLGIDRVVLVGHSMGGFVSTVLTLHYPDRVSDLVLVDGGVPLGTPPPDVDPDVLLAAMLGPAVDRLKMEFESLDSYLDFWRSHPSVQDDGAWNEVFEAYLAYDLTGEPPRLVSKTSTEAVFGDGRDTLQSEDLQVAIGKISCPITFIRAPRGILNERPGLYSDAFVADFLAEHPHVTDVMIDDVNHYTLTTSERGAKLVSEVIRDVLARQTV